MKQFDVAVISEEYNPQRDYALECRGEIQAFSSMGEMIEHCVSSIESCREYYHDIITQLSPKEISHLNQFGCTFYNDNFPDAMNYSGYNIIYPTGITSRVSKT